MRSDHHMGVRKLHSNNYDSLQFFFDDDPPNVGCSKNVDSLMGSANRARANGNKRMNDEGEAKVMIPRFKRSQRVLSRGISPCRPRFKPFFMIVNLVMVVVVRDVRCVGEERTRSSTYFSAHQN